MRVAMSAIQGAENSKGVSKCRVARTLFLFTSCVDKAITAPLPLNIILEQHGMPSNHYVFKLQCAALGVNVDDEGIFMRRRLNDDAHALRFSALSYPG